MARLYSLSLLIVFSFAVIVFGLLKFIPAPYGKFFRKGWGPVIKTKWAWLVMEFPSPALMLLFFILSYRRSYPQILFLAVWLLHYMHRTFIYPFNQSGREKPYPVVIVMMAIIFNILNGFINGYGVFHAYIYDNSYILNWKFILGILIFITGFIINKISDEKLRILRKQNPSEYVIPHGCLFNHISCPHYLGEIIEWSGWAVMTWSLPGLAFAVFTVANLYPRALSSHKWYKEHFQQYPSERRAILPF